MKRKGFRLAFNLFLAFILSFLSITSLNFTSQEVSAADSIPSYSGNASVPMNNNIPTFTIDEITTKSFEIYGALDKLGRSTTALACIGKDLMPTTERGSIGMIKPTGWMQNKYPGVVNSEPAYLYNRCHLIGFQLTGENANEKNLITGTRYMNIEGMLPYENRVANYVSSTGNHVMYRVTPVFEGNNLLCTGVQMEAYSVEDSGKSINFNVFCYNVQPGVSINYADGSNELESNFTVTVKSTDNAQTYERTNASVSGSYVANKNSKKFHYTTCDSVSCIKEKNKVYFDGARDELIYQGYAPCKKCKP